FWTRANINVEADDFARFAALSGMDLSGAGAFAASGDIQPFDGIFDIALDAQTRDLAIGNPQLDPLLTGDSILSLKADRDTTGTRLSRIVLNGEMLSAEGAAAITATGASARFNAAIADLGRAAPALSGAATVNGTVATDAQGVVTLNTQVTAPQASATIQARAVPTEDATGYVVNAQTDTTITDLSPYGDLIGQRLGGSLQTGLIGQFNTVTGAATAELTAQTQGLRAGPAALDPVLAGTGRIDAGLRLSDAGRLRLDALDVQFPNLTVAGNVASSGADTVADLSVRLANIGLFTADYSGPVQADISARQDRQGWQVSGDATGPVGTAATVSGRVDNGGALTLNITGSAPLALANVYIAPRQISGLARFDLSVNGPAALSSVRGPVTISDGRLTAPAIGQTLENLGGTITLAGGTARIDLRGQSTAGGGVALSGPVDLSPPNQAALTIALSDVVLRDPTLYRTTVAGAVSINGPLAGGASITGTLDLGEAEVQVPSTGVSALGALPAVTHLGVPTDVRRTLTRAAIGVTAPTTQARSAGPAYPLDLLVRAPARIFVRGRGLDAELGGSLRVTGTSNEVIPIGRFDLIRGRLDILGQRFELSEGYAQLQGDFSPFIRLAATTEARTGTTVSIIVEGPADDIEVRFESTPALPQDEVLSQLLFGRDLSSISPLQAVQLASAVGTLAGTGGGGGVLSNLRQGLDLDALDITTDENGNAAVSAGKYISENVYTDVTVGSDGTSEINLNLDINRDFTARGTVGSGGDTSIGIFFERDY
ncbi:MAG: translocation/assembly module TamB domain-containing protein, partial [Octadecabacter sp.]|nr:translocation/assembly module TamB domain-containing protein [Octadecabacter sp.]